MNIIIFILLSALFIVFSGLLIYKTGHAPTWESGIKTLFQWAGKGIAWLCQWAYAHSETARQQDQSLIPTLKQLTVLVEKLMGHPYDTPNCVPGWINSSDVFCLRINAFGLTSHYQELKPSEIREIVCAVVNNFFSELWGYVPYYHIPYARTDGFLLFIPLSDFGKQALNRKIEEFEAREAMNQTPAPTKSEPLTEEVSETEDEASE